MKLLYLDYYGTDGGLDFCMRAKADGHDVRWFFKREPRNNDIGKGLVTRVADWRDHMKWADLVVLSDNTHYLRELDGWRKQGVPVVGATCLSATWELDRKTGQDTFKKHGIPVPPFREFSRYDDAIAYIKKEGRAFVSKPSYDESDKSLSYVGKTPADLIYMIQKWKRQAKMKGSFILQEKIGGCEMAVGAFIGPHGFNSGWCENFEEKKLFAGAIGPNVGEMGTSLGFTAKSKLADKVLKPLEDAIVATGHTGYVDVNCIIDEDGAPWPLEFTMRPGWPTFNIQQALVGGDCVEWLASLAAGRDSRPFIQKQMAVGVVTALPQFPYGKTAIEDMVGVPIYGVTEARKSNIHPCCVMQGTAPVDRDGEVVTEGCWLTAGDYVLVTTGVADTVSAAASKAHRLAERIAIPASAFRRVDIGRHLAKDLPLLHKHGYATTWAY
jgi:phosphoribosylamine--glycine ligase